jgi:hypothetical protein
MTPYLDGLDNVAKSVADQCGSVLRDALDHFHARYNDSLCLGGSGKKIKDIYKKLEWSVREKDQLHSLRRRLQDGVQRLTLLTALTVKYVLLDASRLCQPKVVLTCEQSTRASARVDNATMLARIDEVHQLVSKTCQSRQEMLDMLREQSIAGKQQVEKLDGISGQLAAQQKSSWHVLDMVRDTLSEVFEVKQLLLQVSQTVINLQFIASNSIYLRSLDPTRDQPVILEDALGNELPIPAPWLDTLEWEVRSPHSFSSQ